MLDTQKNTKQPFLGDPIEYWKMLELHENYKKEKKKKLSDHIGKEETNAIWFDKNTSLQAFFLRVLGDPELSGVRVYLCDYGKEVKDGIPKKEKYLRQLTIAFVPTVLDGDIHRDLPAVKKEEEYFVLTGAAYDNGSLCPPEGGCN